MAGSKENVVSFHLALQPEEGVYADPGVNDIMAISAPDNGSDAITADDATLTGAIWAAPRLFLGRRGRAGATMSLRGPGGSVVPAANAYMVGRVLQLAGFTEMRNATAITGTAAGGSDRSIILAAAASGVTDFYKGMAIQHANIGTGLIRGSSLIRDYDGATKTARLMEILGTAVAGGQYTIPPQLTYLLSTGASIPRASVKVVRHKKAYRYRDCALSSFALNIPVANDESTDVPTIEFSMVGVPVRPNLDETATPLPSSLLTPVAAAKDGKFALNGVKVGHQSIRFEFGLEAGALPNQNFQDGQESYETMSGTRTVSLDLNQTLVSLLDMDQVTDDQVQLAALSGWGRGPGNAFLVGMPNGYSDPFSPTGRNGFVAVQGNLAPSDVDRSIAISCLYA